MEDEKIVELYFHRNEAAIRYTKEKYGQRLRTLSFGIVEDTQTAEECENDTYMEAWNYIPPKEPKNYFYAFLARIIRHISLDCCRKRDRLKRSAYVTELSEEIESCLPATNAVDRLVDDMVFHDMINGFLKTLDQEKRNIFLRRYWYLDSVAEIAKRYKLSQAKIKTTLFRCRGALREYLEKEDYVL